MTQPSEQERTIAMLTRCMQQSRDGREYNSHPEDETCELEQTQQKLPPEQTGNGEICASDLGQEIFNPPLATPMIWFGMTWPPMGP